MNIRNNNKQTGNNEQTYCKLIEADDDLVFGLGVLPLCPDGG